MHTDTKMVIISGLSGAGKSEAIKAFEDLGYFCVDNLPATLLPKFSELCLQSGGKVDKIALVMDMRGGEFFNNLIDSLMEIERMGVNYEILFLEASTEALIRRFKETRRRHPLAQQGGIVEGINFERKRLEEIRGKANRIIDTSSLSSRELRNKIGEYYSDDIDSESMTITVESFGFKYGITMDSDIVLDCRFLPNPHWVESLRPKTGFDKEVIDYVMKWPVSKRFVSKLLDFLAFLVPNYIKEGKTHLIISIGCTGGKHRSVTLSNIVGEFLKEKGYNVNIEHRDIDAG